MVHDCIPQKSGCSSETDVDAEEAQSIQQKRDPNIVDWDGEDDPEMPINWPARRKWSYIIMLASLTLLTYFIPDPSFSTACSLADNP